MIEVPAGNFVMGADSLDYIEHPVTLTNKFELSKYEISAQEYCDILNFANSENELLIIPDESIKNLNGDQQELVDLNAGTCQFIFAGNEFSVIAGMEQLPVVEVTWYGAAFYCNMYSRIRNENELYSLQEWECDPYLQSGYRLPTEAEWEYAVRYNDQRIYPWGNEPPDSTRVNCFGLGVGGLAATGSYSPPGDSELGFCEMVGNVWEWCDDWYDDYTSQAQINPTGPDDGNRVIIRGAGWMSPTYQLPAAYRSSNYKDHSYYDFGFRLAYLPPQVSADPVLETSRIQNLKNYPNPFNPSTTISFELNTSLRNASTRQAETTESTELVIYNLKGQKVKTLDCTNLFAANARDSRSTYSVIWNGTDNNNKPVSSGIYLIKLKAGNSETSRKVLLMK